MVEIKRSLRSQSCTNSEKGNSIKFVNFNYVFPEKGSSEQSQLIAPWIKKSYNIKTNGIFFEKAVIFNTVRLKEKVLQTGEFS